MTDKERELALYCLKASSDYHSEVCESCINYPNCDHTIQDDVTETIIKALEQESCEDAISRQAVLEQTYNWSKDEFLRVTNPFDYLRKRINSLPSVKPQEPKTGHWIAQDIHNCHTDFKCSECGYIHSFMHLYGKPTADYTYCPNCGAKMESEDKDAT